MTSEYKATLQLLAFILLAGPQAAFADALAEFGLREEMDYLSARHVLLDNGWRPTQDADSEIIDEALPEISCGSGYDAICSVGWQRDSDLLALVVERDEGRWVLVGEY